MKNNELRRTTGWKPGSQEGQTAELSAREMPQLKMEEEPILFKTEWFPYFTPIRMATIKQKQNTEDSKHW